MPENRANAPSSKKFNNIKKLIGEIPYRIALAGGWIDQPFVSKHLRHPPGSMVVVSVEPQFRFMDRSGISTSTREVATKIWHGKLPTGNPTELVEELYYAENQGKPEPSGSQDMIGLIYPGISRLDYDYNYRGGIFPCNIETCVDPQVVRWLENVIYLVPVMPRPEGYNPLGIKNLDPKWIRRLGETGKRCFDAILRMDIIALGKSMNDCMKCWEKILPHTVRHPTIKIDLVGLLKYYQKNYPGAMYSGCGGGYLIVVSNEPVPGGFKIKIRV
jgi:hypothetical protein